MFSSRNPRPWRIALYSHDSLGLGHVRRNLALAHALSEHIPAETDRQITGLLFTGFDSVSEQLPSGFDHVSLPGLSKESGSYQPRRLDVSMTRLVRIRSQLLASSMMAFEPDLVIVDRHALGFRGEFEWALRRLREDRPQVAIVLGLREVLDEPEAAATEWRRLGSPELVADLYDAIWLYGDPRVHDALSTGEVPTQLAGLVTHTGYLSNGRPRRDVAAERPYVLTMVGGGADGGSLCRAAAGAVAPEGHDHIVVTGPQMSDEEYHEIAAQAGAGTRVVRTVPDGLATMRGAAALVSMAGYNTVTEALSLPIPHLLVPRSEPRKEQLIRAQGLAAVGAADYLDAATLTPQQLTGWFASAVGKHVSKTQLHLDGLSRVGKLAAELLTTHRKEAVA